MRGGGSPHRLALIIIYLVNFATFGGESFVHMCNDFRDDD